ncbi:MAG: EamA family transporter [Eubacterium sp.]|nr:EamA family transporter [Candidatus Colimonas fimequi]
MGVISARATSYLFNKMIMDEMGPLTLMADRFLLAFIIMALLFAGRLIRINKREIISGLIIGTAFFAVMVAELYGVRSTESSTCAFLENLAIVIVPIMQSIITRTLPSKWTVIAVLLAITGVGCLTLKAGAFGLGIGELLCILAAVLYATAIITTDRFSRMGDPLLIGIVQVGTMGALGLIFALVFEEPHLPTTHISWLMLIGLAVVCTCFGYTLQPMAQSKTSAERTGLFCSFSPLVAGIVGVVFGHENLGVMGMIGGALIIIAIIVSNKKEAR